MKSLLVALCLFWVLPCSANQSGLHDYTIDENSADVATRTQNQFSGRLLVTPDVDWRQKWNMPEDTVPRFTEQKNVRLGEELTVLILYSSPQPDAQNHIKVICDIKITRPDGLISYKEDNVVCGNQELVGDPANIRLAYSIITYIGELGDPYGKWLVEVTLRDEVGDVKISMETWFRLINQARLI